MISVAEALEAIFALAEPLPEEVVRLEEAMGRVLSQPIKAKLTQPPFAASAMDGYAINAVEADLHAQFKVIGEAAAGHPFEGKVGPGQCTRIFTGAPMPAGTDHVVIQEDTERRGALMTILADQSSSHVRPAGQDFALGDTLDAPLLLTPNHIALAAAMNHAALPVRRKPIVALISTGDELVSPGNALGAGQIVASNTYGLKALIEANGAEARLLPIARDTRESLETVFSLTDGADVIVTIGGASVGDHDLVGEVAAGLGLERSFYKVAMRPGKPLMAGRMGDALLLGLPGNPVSAMVCGHVFLLPLLRALQGLGTAPAPRQSARLASALGKNGPREHYMRATVESGDIKAAERQDSALLTVLTSANALLIRPPHDEARAVGEKVSFISI